jgi:ribokinase
MHYLVAGHINIETTVRVAGFPIEYGPVHYPFHGIASTVSGVGINVCAALRALGVSVTLLAQVGGDQFEPWVRHHLADLGVADEHVLALLRETCQSVILYEPSGRRQIHVDLKTVQESPYPAAHFRRALAHADACMLTNMNFVRPFLAEARGAGKLVATDVHAVRDLDDAYNSDFMRSADLLAMSHELLPTPPEEWAEAVLGRYAPQVLVVGLGAGGALLATRDEGVIGRFPARVTRPIVSTVGAGDALFSCFVEGYARTRDARSSLRRAIAFASWKIGAASGGEGFPDREALQALLGEEQ